MLNVRFRMDRRTIFGVLIMTMLGFQITNGQTSTSGPVVLTMNDTTTSGQLNKSSSTNVTTNAINGSTTEAINSTVTTSATTKPPTVADVTKASTTVKSVTPKVTTVQSVLTSSMVNIPISTVNPVVEPDYNSPLLLQEAMKNTMNVTFYGIYMSEWNDNGLEWKFRAGIAYQTNEFCGDNMDICGVTIRPNSTYTGFKDSDVVIVDGYPKADKNTLTVKYYLKFPPDVTLDYVPPTNFILNKNAIFYSSDSYAGRDRVEEMTGFAIIGVSNKSYLPPADHFWNVIFIPVAFFLLIIVIVAAVSCHLYRVRKQKQGRREKKEKRKEKKELKTKLLNTNRLKDDDAGSESSLTRKNKVGPGDTQLENGIHQNDHSQPNGDHLFVIENERPIPKALPPQHSTAGEATHHSRLPALPPPSVRKEDKKEKKKKKKKKHKKDKHGAFENPLYGTEGDNMMSTMNTTHQPMNSTMNTTQPMNSTMVSTQQMDPNQNTNVTMGGNNTEQSNVPHKEVTEL
ncbi:unnamed protein product [Owenia fusiformis]|uniref:DUF8077 domain-containing protein n=1 Tax=Owenia fusiformis TaxID=6347 RepID=A0A8J1XP34_OWEFU|nr:unnamed protein product [Owenia fusiformis]